MSLRHLAVLGLALSLSGGCNTPPAAAPAEAISPAPPRATAPPPDEAPPTGRLPQDVRPRRYQLELEIDPSRESFSGAVDIEVDLARPRDVIWLHGDGLTATDARVTAAGTAPQAARYEQATDGGVAKLSLEKPLPPGPATIHIAFEGPFGKRLNGLYKVTTEGEDYAFTQMEPVWTRKAFPCFDEPRFKVPWTISLVTPQGETAIANSAEIASEPAGAGMTRHRYAETPPLPSYLIAFAVGPLDVVQAPPIPPNAARAEPLPFRGVAAKGRGDELAFALEHTPPILAELERYFGIGYPYDKLDVIAVPDKSGAMENAGAVTFREWLLLVDPSTASTTQKRAFAYVMAHELAHQWFGNLVTMPWWDDIWLNEAFATWMGHRAVERWDRSYQSAVRQLDGVHQAMDADSLLSARQIRQPVDDEDGIHNAFDVITYRKGGGVLAMFERWMGPEVFRAGLRQYMRDHRHGNATAADLMRAFGEAAKRDVATPFDTFLEQPGLPNVHLTVSCDGEPTITLEQSRFLPLGSEGEAAGTQWQIPICLRLSIDGRQGEDCRLVTKKVTRITPDGCPDWVFPNAGAAGYYQWSAEPDALKALTTEALATLDVREKMSLAKAVRGMMARGAIEADAAFEVLAPLAVDDHPDVAGAPMAVLGRARDWLAGDPLLARAQQRIRRLYAPRLAALGWSSRPGETAEDKLLRRNLLRWLAIAGEDRTTRRRAALLAKRYLGYGSDERLHPEAIDPDLAGTLVYIAGQDADSILFKAIYGHFDRAPDAAVRGQMLASLAAARTKPLPGVALDLTLDEALKVSERMMPLRVQMHDPATREGAWTWLEDNVDAVMEKISARRAGWLPGVATSFCDASRVADVEALFTPRLSKMAGGKREVAKAKEALRTCAAKKAHLLPGLRRLLAR